MKVIHVLRKPLSESTVAKNVLKHGAGGLNIDASRLAYMSDADKATAFPGGRTTAASGNLAGKVQGGATRGDFAATQSDRGRWPANVILQHLPDCQCVGSKQVKSDGHYPAARPAGSQVSGPSGHAGQEGLSEQHTSGETVPVWACVEGCPIAALDVQSGSSQSAVRQGGEGEHLDPTREGWRFKRAAGGFTDTGGASRFFKQVGGGQRG